MRQLKKKTPSNTKRLYSYCRNYHCKLRRHKATVADRDRANSASKGTLETTQRNTRQSYKAKVPPLQKGVKSHAIGTICNNGPAEEEKKKTYQQTKAKHARGKTALELQCWQPKAKETLRLRLQIEKITWQKSLTQVKATKKKWRLYSDTPPRWEKGALLQKADKEQTFKHQRGLSLRTARYNLFSFCPHKEVNKQTVVGILTQVIVHKCTCQNSVCSLG